MSDRSLALSDPDARPWQNGSVLILKPVGQESSLRAAFEEQGAKTLFLPLMSIEPLPWAPEKWLVLERILRAERIVITSPNVVYFLKDILIEMGFPIPRDRIRWSTMGKSTADLLVKEWGIEGAYYPLEGTGSEALFRLPLWEGVEEVGYLKGEGGRDWLPKALSAKGIRITTLDLYQRVFKPVEASLWEKIDPKQLDLLVATSGEIIKYFLEQAHLHLDLNCLLKVPILVPGGRLQRYVQDLGFEHIEMAPTPSKSDLIQTSLRFRKPTRSE